MLDPLEVFEALAAAAGVAALLAAAGILLFFGRPRTPRPAHTAGGALGVGVALLLGCRVLGQWPHWPPREGLDRFLLLLLPAAVVVEVLASWLPRWPAWGLRLL